MESSVSLLTWTGKCFSGCQGHILYAFLIVRQFNYWISRAFMFNAMSQIITSFPIRMTWSLNIYFFSNDCRFTLLVTSHDIYWFKVFLPFPSPPNSRTSAWPMEALNISNTFLIIQPKNSVKRIKQLSALSNQLDSPNAKWMIKASTAAHCKFIQSGFFFKLACSLIFVFKSQTRLLRSWIRNGWWYSPETRSKAKGDCSKIESKRVSDRKTQQSNSNEFSSRRSNHTRWSAPW